MRLRRVLEEVEAELAPQGEALTFRKARGKMERKSYGDGTERFKLKCQGLELSDGANLAVLLGGREVAQMVLSGGRGEVDVEGAGGQVPVVRAGDLLEVRYNGQVLLSGSAVED